MVRTSSLRDTPRENSNLKFLNGQGGQADLFQVLDLHVFDQVVQLGDGFPLLVFSFTPMDPVVLTMAMALTY